MYCCRDLLLPTSGAAPRSPGTWHHPSRLTRRWAAQDALNAGSEVFDAARQALSVLPHADPEWRPPETFQDAVEWVQAREAERKRRKERMAASKSKGETPADYLDAQASRALGCSSLWPMLPQAPGPRFTMGLCAVDAAGAVAGERRGHPGLLARDERVPPGPHARGRDGAAALGH